MAESQSELDWYRRQYRTAPTKPPEPIDAPKIIGQCDQCDADLFEGDDPDLCDECLYAAVYETV